MDPWEIQRTLLAFALAGGALRGERMLFAPEGDANGGGGGGSGEGGNTQQGPPAAEQPKYTDKQLNDLIAKNVAKALEKHKGESEAAIKAAREEAEAAKNEAALAGKSADERAKAIAESDARKRAAEAEKLAKDLADNKAARERAETALKTRIARGSAQTALIEAKVLAAMAGDALDLFMTKAKFEHDTETDEIVGVTLEGAFYKTPKDAAEAFLKTRPGFMPAPAGGSGTPRGGSAGNFGRPLHELSTSELLARAEEADRNGR